MKFKNLVTIIFSLLLASALSGCWGTLGTRSNVALGAYPFEAVYSDVTDPWREGAEAIPIDILALPIDLAIDAVLSPADVIAWICGARKSGLNDTFGRGNH